MQYRLLAHAAGISGDTIHAAFKSDTTLKSDFEALRTARKAMDACIIAGTCTNQVATYASAQQALTQEKLTVWQNLFAAKGVNNAAAVSLKTNLDNLIAQKHELLHSVFSSAAGTSGTPQLTPQ